MNIQHPSGSAGATKTELTSRSLIEDFWPGQSPVMVAHGRPAHTCASGTHARRGSHITFGMSGLMAEGYSDHDWRNCEGCRYKTSSRRVNQIEVQRKRGPVKVTTFDSFDDFQTVRNRWNVRASRGGDQTVFFPAYRDDGKVTVFHNSTKEDGLEVPQGNELLQLIFDLHTHYSPGKRNRASNGWGGAYKGTRGDGRSKDEDTYEVITNVSTARLAKDVWPTERDTFGRIKFEGSAPDLYLPLLDLQYAELQKEDPFLVTIEEAKIHKPDNEVMLAIFEDERVQEALARNKELLQSERVQEALQSKFRGNVTDNVHISDPMDNNGYKDKHEGEERQLSFPLARGPAPPDPYLVSWGGAR